MESLAFTASLAPSRKRTLFMSCVAHMVHDGYSDLIYLLLPIWKTDFALSYAMLAVVRALYGGAMAGLQLPAGRLAERIGGKAVLVVGTAIAAVGFVLTGFSTGIVGLSLALIVAGAGSSVQHPIASAAVTRAYRPHQRAALGTYNFSGDLGKAAVPASIALVMTMMTWRTAMSITGLFGFLAAGGLAAFMPRVTAVPVAETHKEGGARGGFGLLLAIGLLDTGCRMGLLTFLPFLLQAKGATVQTTGLALALLFLGGAGGKFMCGWLGSRLGMLRTVLLTEGGTAACIFAALVLPLHANLVLMPILGAMLNGTSSVLYGTVPELVPPHKVERAFGLFYTGILGSGAIAPVLFGLLGDALGPTWATTAVAVSALATLPLAMLLAPQLTSTREAA